MYFDRLSNVSRLMEGKRKEWGMDYMLYIDGLKYWWMPLYEMFEWFDWCHTKLLGFNLLLALRAIVRSHNTLDYDNCPQGSLKAN